MHDPTRTSIDKRKKQKCPVCGKAPSTEHKPFCSTRCHQVDLHRWLGGTYRIATDEVPNDNDLDGLPEKDS